MPVHLQRLPSLQHTAEAPELVLLHGWGMSSAVWAPWLPLLRERCNITLLDLPGYGLSEPQSDISIDELLALCIDKLPAKAVYIGYSLGGMLAVNIASRYPHRVLALVTLASNISFVATDAWPWAMDVDTYDTFFSLVAENAELALKRFSGLQAANNKALIKNLRAKSEVFADGVLLTSLNWLAGQNNHAAMSGLAVPALCLYGEQDNLLPVAAADSIQRDYSVEVVVIDGAPHALFLSHPTECWKKIASFLIRQNIFSTVAVDKRRLDKQRVAESFSRAAATYDGVADLQRRVGEQLMTYLPSTSADTLLDLGCGTGFFGSSLSSAVPNGHYIGLDLAEGMVGFASTRVVKQDDGSSMANASWLCGDAENLPLAENSIDWIFSSLAIQWCENNDALFSELFRVLRPGGRVVFSTLGPNTLHELRNAWRAVDDFIHVNQFVEQEVLLSSIAAAGFKPSTIDGYLVEENIMLEYHAIKHLTRELKALGAHNVNSGRPVGLTGKHRMRAFINAYEQQRNLQGKLPASYQVWYGALQKPRLSE